MSFIAKVAQYQVEGAKIPSSKELYKSGQELMKDRLAKGLDTVTPSPTKPRLWLELPLALRASASRAREGY